MRMTLGRRERMGSDRWHQVEDRICRGDPYQGPLGERRIASALLERTGLEESVRGDLSRGGLSFALVGLLGSGGGTLGKALRGQLYLGRYKEVLERERKRRGRGRRTN